LDNGRDHDVDPEVTYWARIDELALGYGSPRASSWKHSRRQDPAGPFCHSEKAVPMTEPLFSTKVVDSDDGPIIYVQGEIDMTTAGRLRNAIEPHMGPRQTIILDFSGVEFLDSSCIAVLVHARGSLSADGGTLILRNPSRLARRVLTLTGIEFILAEDAASHPQPD